MLTLSSAAEAQASVLANADPVAYIAYATKATAINRLFASNGLRVALAGETLLAVLNHRYDVHEVSAGPSGAVMLIVSDPSAGRAMIFSVTRRGQPAGAARPRTCALMAAQALGVVVTDIHVA